MNKAIVDVHADQILDSRGWPTLHVEVLLNDHQRGIAEIPAGASTGTYEAVELRDGDHPYRGRGVRRAQALIHEVIRPALVGRDPTDQAGIDQWLIRQDGTTQKEKWGANTILGVSLAVARAAAKSQGMPLYRYWSNGETAELPTPQLNVINGGAHADNDLDVQEFLLIPGGASSFAQALQMGVETYHALKDRLKRQGFRTAVGDEGGFAPQVRTPEEVFDLLVASIEDAGYTPGRDIALGVDVAANSIRREHQYAWQGALVEATDLIGVYRSWIKNYPVVSLEDGLAEDDWEGWAMMTHELGSFCQIVGDDLFVTHAARLRRGIADHSANAVLIKLNQVGTVTETLEVLRMSQEVGWNTVISHRSGETCDTSLADLAVAVSAGQVKTGAPQRGERIAKYNRLLLIEARDPQLPFAGWRFGITSRPQV